MKNSFYAVRDATEDDHSSIVQMIKESTQESEIECKMDVTAFKRDANAGLFECLVAENKESGEILGFALFCFTYSTRSGINASLEDVFVKPVNRKHGIGTNLIRHVAKRAVGRNCSQMRSSCSEWNIIGLNLHKRLGADDVTEEETCHMIRFEKRALMMLTE